MIYEVQTSISGAFTQAWDSIASFLPMFLTAIIIFVIGWFISIGLGKLVANLLKRVGFDNIFNKTGWQKALRKAELKITPSQFIGVITKWIFVIIFLIIVSDIVKWENFSSLLNQIITWVPNLIVAIVILVVSIVIADILEKIIKATIDKVGIASANFLGSLAKWVIYVVATLAILSQLNVAPAIVNAIIYGIVGAFVLSFGLAFGLGGRDEAAKILATAREKIEGKKPKKRK
ncbi:MAG: hypothetical protein PHO04_01640 [Candidatus Pacebacteria bacterium]|jgi:hypothetical protein|nr:hypothetical protein [Candidatus Paceibacterota bacterium]MDD2796662.1 hypothetical protein [Candidatus Paceibacterota bacterium]MDD3048330.1 hypothetical protein [Candidatus Paceibacterota bacterium]MDD3510248.1 hypothetical protein [Candidatus Paceibacterota bacterium]MDD3918599.1 hypothetical protein [Candidatus Paceibacterota bacterium]